MSYTIFDRICEAVADELYAELGEELVEEIWDEKIRPILERFMDAEDELWSSVGRVIDEYKERN